MRRSDHLDRSASESGTRVAVRGTMLRPVSVLTVSALLSGCLISSQFTPLREPPHPPVSQNPSDIEIFASSVPRRPHVDVALLFAAGFGGWASQIQRLREEAAKHGCDAIALGGGYGATCIMYTAPESPLTVPCVPVAAIPSPAPIPVK